MTTRTALEQVALPDGGFTCRMLEFVPDDATMSEIENVFIAHGYAIAALFLEDDYDADEEARAAIAKVGIAAWNPDGRGWITVDKRRNSEGKPHALFARPLTEEERDDIRNPDQEIPATPWGGWPQDEDAWDHNTGIPGINLFGAAIQVWSSFQNKRRVSVAEAAEAFKIAPQQIVEAVEHHPWMYLVGDTQTFSQLYIDHDGE